MEMKAAGISIALIAAVFMAFVSAEDEYDCGEAEAMECIEIFMLVISGNLSVDDNCEKIHKMTDCFQNVRDECLGEESRYLIDLHISATHLSEQWNLECGGVGIDVEDLAAEKCVAENLEDVMECQANGLTQASTFLRSSPFIKKREDITANLRKCLTYGLIADCVEKRLIEKCGEDVAEKAVEKMTKNIPENIREACTAQEYVEFSSHYGITGDKKK